MPYVACKKCLKVFKFTSHETGNTHLKRHVEACKKSPPWTSSKSIQLKLNFSRKKVPNQLKKVVLKGAVELVAKDMRPFSVLDGNGMKAFSQCLINAGAMYGQVDCSEILPSRNTLSKALRETAVSEREKLISLVIKAIEDNGGVATTTDLWTDNHIRQSYISCTVQFVKGDTVKNCAIFWQTI